VATYEGIQGIPLIAGHPALDLVNTVEPRLPAGAQDVPVLDHLVAPAELLIWVQRAGLLTDAEAEAEAQAWDDVPAVATRSLDGVRAEREALHTVLSGLITDTRAVPDALAELHANWAAACARSELRVASDGRRGVRLQVGTQPGLRVLDRVAQAAIDVLTLSDLAVLRACPLDEGGCGWVFLDRSRGRSRRWCVMADCGAKAKARRLTDRRRANRSRQAPG
jgi:predicted RNA-binding Zn ribbon-like protein